MLNIKIKILDKRLGGDFPLPQYETALSAGMDLRAMVDSDFVLNPGEVKMVNTGFAMHIADPDVGAASSNMIPSRNMNRTKQIRTMLAIDHTFLIIFSLVFLFFILFPPFKQ